MTLLSRVAKLEGADREVDLMIATVLAPDVVCLRHNVETQANEPFTHWEYTKHADDAGALIERTKPGWAYGFDKGPKTVIAFVDRHDYADRMFGARYTAEGSTPAIALVLALLHALQDQGETG